MHEFSLIQNLMTVLDKTVKDNNLKKVTSVTIKIGALRQVVPEFMEFAYKTLTKDTILANSRLIILPVPITMQCSNCGHEFEADPDTYL